MIIDKLENWKTYPFGPAWKMAFEFLLSLDAEAEEGKYPLQGEDIFASVASYKTKKPEEAVLETHRKYVDIQIILAGREKMEWSAKDTLTVDTPYEKSKDAEFYKRLSPGPASIDVLPGTFVVFFPQDGHMPALMSGKEPERVKKVVVKIDAKLLK